MAHKEEADMPGPAEWWKDEYFDDGKWDVNADAATAKEAWDLVHLGFGEQVPMAYKRIAPVDYELTMPACARLAGSVSVKRRPCSQVAVYRPCSFPVSLLYCLSPDATCWAARTSILTARSCHESFTLDFPGARQGSSQF